MVKQALNFSVFAERLKALKLELQDTTELVKDAAKPVELDQNKVGRLSRMDAMQGQAMASANAERQLELMQAIDRALGEIEKGDYGQCIECDESIAPARLMADPVAQTCIVCATKLEQV